jgi:4'-phosphopantetheinyl transferase
MHKDQVRFGSNLWDMGPKRLELAEDEVHVWHAFLECGAIAFRQFEATLSSDEKARANRFFFQRDRVRFITTRGILRELLGRYLKRAAADLEFEYGPQGKPALSTKSSQESVHFNVSHSHGIALLAFTVGRELGVDVELVRQFGGLEIAERYFSPREVMELNRLHSSQQDEGFFLCWTRKEAYLKARGEGLHVPLKSFHVTLTPGKPERLETKDGLQWSLYSLRPDAHYVGALVGEGKGWKLHCWHWRPPDETPSS